MRSAKKKESRPVREKPEDKIWREEFEQLTIDDHDGKLKSLGLDEEDIEEFNEKFSEDSAKKEKKK